MTRGISCPSGQTPQRIKAVYGYAFIREPTHNPAPSGRFPVQNLSRDYQPANHAE